MFLAGRRAEPGSASKAVSSGGRCEFLSLRRSRGARRGVFKQQRNDRETFPMNSKHPDSTVPESRGRAWPGAALVLLLGLLVAASAVKAAPKTGAGPGPVLDDYSDSRANKLGVDRFLVDDKGLGGRSKATVKCENGVLSVEGDLAPGRGAPAFISQVSLLAAGGKAGDLSGYEGVKLRVKVIKGSLCVQVSSTVVTNFDYHTSAPIPGTRGAFQEVRIPFKDLRRGWSPQTPLDLKAITAINLVSYGMAAGSFAYQVDELGFY